MFLELNCERETSKIVAFLKDTFQYKGFSKAVIGISGGLDSAVVGSLLVKALGKENVYGYMLPYKMQSDFEDAVLVSKTFLQNICVGEITNSVDTIIKHSDLQPTEKNYLIRVGNIKARTRMIMLYDLSMKCNALVVGAENKTELMLGYFTLYGDGACAMEPIGHLYKTQVFQLGKYLGIPEAILKKKPSAGLWEGQTDEEELGINYKEIDEWLYLSDVHEVKEGQGIWTQDKWLKIKTMIEKNRFKSRLPDIIEEE